MELLVKLFPPKSNNLILFIFNDIVIKFIVDNEAPQGDPLIEQDSERMILKYLKRYGQRPVLVRLKKVTAPEWGDQDFSALFN